MKTKEEIEKLAESEYGTEIGSIRGSNPYDLEKDRKNGFIKGYTQCQEDMQKDVEYWQSESDHWHQQAMEMTKYKYTEKDMKKAFEYGKTLQPFDCFEDFINSLNKQD
jgi:hypothetical protein